MSFFDDFEDDSKSQNVYRDFDETQLPSDYPSIRQSEFDETRLVPQDIAEVNETLLSSESKDLYPVLYLLVKRPVVNRGTMYRLPYPNATIGRKIGDIRLTTDRRVSGVHARIKSLKADSGCYKHFIVDLDSRGGSMVNGQKIDGRHLLSENDEIQIGDHVFQLKILNDSE